MQTNVSSYNLTWIKRHPVFLAMVGLVLAAWKRVMVDAFTNLMYWHMSVPPLLTLRPDLLSNSNPNQATSDRGRAAAASTR